MKKKVIVTGGLGFIGSNLIKLLIKKGFFVINIDKISYSSNFNNLENVNKKKYVFYKANINDQKIVKKILLKYKPIGIFNLAAETHVDRSIDNPKSFIKNNIYGTFNLLESIRFYLSKYNNSFKLIHISTDEVYGDIVKKKFSSETDTYNPSSPYAASKSASDLIIKSYMRTFKLPAIITNCCNNYGPNQYPEKLIPKLILNIKNNQNLSIYGNGLNEREWIYVTDHCLALIKIFLKGKIGESYNIGTKFIEKNINIARKLISMSKKFNNSHSKIIFIKDRPGHDMRYALNSSKLIKNLKWKPKYNFNRGIKETLKWYNNNDAWLNKIKKKNYNKRIGIKNCLPKE